MDENVEPTEQESEDAPVSEESQTPQPKPEVSQDAKNLAMLCHLLGLFTLFLCPLIIWLLKNDDPFVDSQGKEALNFQLSVFLGLMISCIVFCLAPVTIPVIMVLDVIFSIIACTKASKGEDYRYPLCVRLVK